MILNKKVYVKIGPAAYKWYKDKGYDISVGKIIEVNIEDVTKSSTCKIEVECQNCGKINAKKFNNYKDCLNKSFDGKYYCKKCGLENKNITNIKKYGSKSPLINDNIKQKSKKTMLNNYGVDNISKVEYIKSNRSKFMKMNTEEYNRIILEKYGRNVSKLDYIKEKKKNTMLKNWGVENPSQSIELFEKAQKTGKKIKLHNIGLYYRGTYEKDFLDYCQLNNIKIEKGPSISFMFNGKKKYYHSDFFIKNENLIIEIKSSYYYERFKELNLEKEKAAINNGYKFLFLIDKNYPPLPSLPLK